MSKMLLVLGMATAVTVTGVMMWKAAEATPLSGATGSLAAIKSHSAIQKIGCIFGTQRCPAGTKWACVKHPGPNRENMCLPPLLA